MNRRTERQRDFDRQVLMTVLVVVVAVVVAGICIERLVR